MSAIWVVLILSTVAGLIPVSRSFDRWYWRDDHWKNRWW
jgi:hypothetical protein